MPWDRLLQNDGIRCLNPLDQIQRHALNKIGRHLRCILTRDRRQVENHWLEQRQRGLKGHRYCSQPGMDPDQAKRETQSRANQIRSRMSSKSESRGRSQQPLQYSHVESDTRKVDRRAQLFYCDVCAEIHNKEMDDETDVDARQSRPLTSSPEPLEESMTHSFYNDKQNDRPVTNYVDRPSTVYRLASREKSAPAKLQEKSEFYNALPKSAPLQKPCIKRSASSIPGKSRQYILVHRPKFSREDELPEASMVEERLIRKRFPHLKHRWLPEETSLTPKPWLYHLYEGQTQL